MKMDPHLENLEKKDNLDSEDLKENQGFQVPENTQVFLDNQYRLFAVVVLLTLIFLSLGGYCLPGAPGKSGEPGVPGPPGAQGFRGFKGQCP